MGPLSRAEPRKGEAVVPVLADQGQRPAIAKRGTGFRRCPIANDELITQSGGRSPVEHSF
jgi:hypothetical protein